MSRAIIYDVGVNDGSDSAFYLRQGFRVVGIEANPASAAALRSRFAASIEDGAFTLLEVGIADAEGEFPFWVCDDHPEWSSFDRAIASRNGARHHSVTVRARRFADLLREHGLPHHCKIDIEGNDRSCITGLPAKLAPAYISIEMSHADGDVDLRLLRTLGYDAFKIISQRSLAQPDRRLAAYAAALPGRARGAFLRGERLLRGVSSVDGWKFPPGSSGPFGERTHGPWKSFSQVLSLWSFLRDLNEKHGTGGLGDWYDIHARRRGIA